MQPYGVQPARLLYPWDSPGKNTEVGCHALLHGIFLTQGLNLCPLHIVLHILFIFGGLHSFFLPFIKSLYFKAPGSNGTCYYLDFKDCWDLPKTTVSVRAGRRGSKEGHWRRRCSRRRSERCLEGGLLQHLEACLRKHFPKSRTVNTRQGFGDSGSYRLLFFFHKEISLGTRGKKGDEATSENTGWRNHIVTWTCS